MGLCVCDKTIVQKSKAGHRGFHPGLLSMSHSALITGGMLAKSIHVSCFFLGSVNDVFWFLNA